MTSAKSTAQKATLQNYDTAVLVSGAGHLGTA